MTSVTGPGWSEATSCSGFPVGSGVCIVAVSFRRLEPEEVEPRRSQRHRKVIAGAEALALLDAGEEPKLLGRPQRIERAAVLRCSIPALAATASGSQSKGSALLAHWYPTLTGRSLAWRASISVVKSWWFCPATPRHRAALLPGFDRDAGDWVVPSFREDRP